MSLAPRLPTEYLGDSEALEHPVPASASPEMFLGGFTSPWMGLGKIMSWAAFVPRLFCVGLELLLLQNLSCSTEECSERQELSSCQ